MAKLQPKPAKPDDRKVQLAQTDLPMFTLEQALAIPKGLWDDFAGKGAEPHHLALSLSLSPTSSGWRMLCGASIAYGLSNGGYNAASIALTDIGKKIVSPLDEGDIGVALREACLKPKILGEFYRRYDKAKFPKDEIAKNVLVSLGIPKDRADRALEIVKRNGEFCGFILQTKTGPFVAITGGGEGPRILDRVPANDDLLPDEDDDRRGVDNQAPDLLVPKEVPLVANSPRDTAARPSKVFITHGKNRKILEQVRELVSYGKFEPIIAQERETAAKAVPDKVMDDMRSCQAAVIHVGIDGVLYDAEQREVPQINQNVLIEIGAAMALYGKKFILLVEEGVDLPTNLKGLYECRYKGDELSMTATMKLLKAFNDFG